MKKNEELWITNINRSQDISLGDLALTVRRGQSVNLLAKKKNGWPRYTFTREQVDASIASGSIFKKGAHIKVRKIAPEVFINRVEVAPILDTSAARVTRKPQEIEVVEFPDLDFDEGSDEAFAAENADMDAADRAPILAVDPIFKRTDE
jgi:hypothetical protein